MISLYLQLLDFAMAKVKEPCLPYYLVGGRILGTYLSQGY